jgi:hypothetical protein
MITKKTKTGYTKTLHRTKDGFWMGYNSEPIYNGKSNSTYSSIGLELVTKDKAKARRWIS